MTNKAITNYWMKHYVDHEVGLCSLCGNIGVVDTRATAISPMGIRVGKLDFCICPNGQVMRASGLNISQVFHRKEQEVWR